MIYGVNSNQIHCLYSTNSSLMNGNVQHMCKLVHSWTIEYHGYKSAALLAVINLDGHV